MRALMGQTLGQYRIDEKIGQGGMATVFRAYQPALERFVAVKVIPFTTQEPGFVERFKREAKAIARLQHPNILPVYDFGVDSGYSYIVMQYVEGGQTLQSRMRRLFNQEEAISLISQIGNALAYAHQRGVIHRDLKPGNILMDKEWALLSDFGLAKLNDASVELSKTGDLMGTPSYMSPEQLTAENIDHRADIYALGVIFYQMLTGIIPHKADTLWAIALKRRSERPKSPSSFNPAISKDVEQIILRVLSIKPEDRYDNVVDFINALQTGSDTQPTVLHQKDTPQDAIRASNVFSAPFLVPPPTPHFVGRQRILTQLEEKLTSSQGRSIIGLYGLGGSGKTALATQLAHKLRPHFEDGILWAQLDVTPPETALLNFANAFGQGKPVAEVSDMAAKAALVRQILTHKHILIILDNAEDSEQIKHLLPAGDRTATLITTRNSKLLANVGAAAYRIGPFNQAEGAALLTDIAGKERIFTEMQAVKETIDLVGGLPLALSIMAGYLVEADDMTIAEYNTELKTQQALEVLKDWEDLSKNVAASFELSYIKLPKPVRKLFAALSVFDGPDFSGDALSAIARLSPFEIKKSMARLRSFSMVERGFEERKVPSQHPSTLQERYRLHPLLKQFAKTKLGAEKNVLLERLAVYFAGSAPQDAALDYHILDADWENVIGGIHWAYENQRWLILAQGVQRLTRINLGVIGFLDARGHWKEGRKILGWALKGAETLNDPVLQAALLIKSGIFADRTGDSEAAENYFQQGLALLGQLAVTEETLKYQIYLYEAMARVTAREDRQQGLNWLKRGLNVLDATNFDALTPEKGYFYIQLSSVLGRMGNLEEAGEAAKKGLALLPSSPNAARVSAYMNLGNIFGMLGDSETSIAYIQSGIEMAQTLGDFRRLATLWENLGVIKDEGGNYAEAIEYYRKSLNLRRKMGHINEGYSHSHLGLSYILLGEDEKALYELTTAVEFAETHNLTDLKAFARTNLARLQVHQGQLDQASANLDRACEICLKLPLPDELPEVLRRQAEIALLNGDLLAASELAERSLQAAKDANYLLSEGISWRILGNVLSAKGESNRAETAYKNSLSILSNQDPYELAQTSFDLGNHYLKNKRGNAEIVASLFQKALTTFESLGAKREVALIRASIAEAD